MSSLSRAWINAPSQHDEMHFLHGERVLVDKQPWPQHAGGTKHTVYFLRGDTMCMLVPTSSMSLGWHCKSVDGVELVTRKVESLKDET